jgi:Tfp pilus assembly protein PilV
MSSRKTDTTARQRRGATARGPWMGRTHSSAPTRHSRESGHLFLDSRFRGNDCRLGSRKPEGAAGDEGVALILVLLAMLVMSALAATIVYTARAETFASNNYKLETEADYLAKAGIERAVNWFRSNHYAAIQQAQASTFYAVTSTGSPYNLYTANNSPVNCVSGCSSSNAPVQLLGYPTFSTNFPGINNTASPAISVATAFKNDLYNVPVTDSHGNQLGTFSVRAKLMNYQTVGLGTEPPYTIVPVETWMITALANYTGGQGITLATAEEEAIVQPIFIPTWGNALYGFCNVNMNGSAGTCTDAFNSAFGAYGGGNATVAAGTCDATTSNNVIAAGANVGANGTVSLGSNVTVAGNVVIGSDPTSGCVPCSTTTSYCGSTSSVKGQVINGPYKPAPPPPTFPAGFPGSAPSYSLGTGTVQVLPVNGTWTSVPPGSFPGNGALPSPPTNSPTCMDTNCDGTAAHPYEINNISMTGGGKSGNAPVLEFVGSTNPSAPIYYDIGSLSENQGQINISGYVVLNIQSGLTITGLGISNGVSADIPPEYLEMNYAGTSDVTINGNGAVSAVLNAPNATVALGGGGNGGYFVGAIQSNNVSVLGGYPVHYDLQLGRMGGSMGVVTTTAYSRQKM